MDSWAVGTAFQFNIVRGTYSDPCNESDLKNGVRFASNDCGDAWGNSTLAVCHYWYRGTTLTQTDIVFNSNKSWDVYSTPLQGSVYDFSRVAVHELGHALGLDHEDSGVRTIMTTYIGNITIPQQDDINGVAALYGSTTVASPGSITVPSRDDDGSYTIRWAASTTAGVSYTLEEATDSTFTTGLRTAYRGTARSTTISRRSPGVTYYYRVMATKSGYTDSDWIVGTNGCTVYQISSVASPGSISVPSSDDDGSYTISWAASATAGASYTLEEATDSTFTTELRTAYSGTSLLAAIIDRTAGVTYYYRVRATKSGYTASDWTVGENGCTVSPPTIGATWSSGAYSNNADIAETLSVPEANSLIVTITGETESNYDFLYIYDVNGLLVRQSSGLINETFVISGSSLGIRFISDDSITKSGVTVVAIPGGPISNDRFFAFAEATFPDVFSGTPTAGEYYQFNYRYYPESTTYLAVDTSGMIFIMGPITGNALYSLCPVTALESAIIAWENFWD